MKLYHFIALLFCSAALLSTGAAADRSGVTVLKGSGGSIRTALSARVVLNEKSDLQREWITISDKSLSVVFMGLTGIDTMYESKTSYSSSRYIYRSIFTIDCLEPITAVEIKFIAFDVWGKTIKTLVQTEIANYGVGIHRLTAQWNLFSENEASEFYASIAYISRVRTKEGKVLVADLTTVLEEAKIFNTKFEASELEPEKPAKK